MGVGGLISAYLHWSPVPMTIFPHHPAITDISLLSFLTSPTCCADRYIDVLVRLHSIYHLDPSATFHGDDSKLLFALIVALATIA
jgi:hypothetical protein